MTSDPMLAALRRWSILLDSAFRVPGTRVTFGLDPILGLVPGLGDLITPAFTLVLLYQAARLRIPRIALLRMVLNAAIDFALGMLPVAGDLFDVGWKANLRNLALLERHARPGTSPSPGDWLFVVGVMVGLMGLALAPILVGGWLIATALGHP